MLFYISSAILALALVWYYLKKPLNYWSDQGIPQTKPWILIGDMWNIISRRIGMADFMQSIYDLYPTESCVGWYNFSMPALLLRDPKLIKQVFIQDFAHFTDHRKFVDPDVDLLWGRNLLSLNGERWKEMRHLLSPIFTTSKIKTVYQLMTETAETFIEHFNAKNEDLIELDMKVALTRYTNDVIATTAFGVKVNSLNEPENTFHLMGEKISNNRGFINSIKMIFMQIMPSIISKYLGLKFLNPVAGDYFQKIIYETIRARENNQIVRHDLVHLLLEARKDQTNTETNGKSKHVEISNFDIASQALIFLFAGFDTVASAMSFGSYELAVNKGIQDRLREEIMQVVKDGKVSYESLQEMKYMDMVVLEILRKWPPFPQTDRLCTKSYIIKPSEDGGKLIRIKKGQEIILPIFAIQRDPKYFPNPNKFDPERFSDENKHNIVPYTNLGFGVGPRNCIGNRFALIEIKTLLFNLLLNYEIVRTKKTVTEEKVSKDFQLDLEGGFHLGLKRIKQ